jgi:hypothetical protein
MKNHYLMLSLAIVLLGCTTSRSTPPKPTVELKQMCSEEPYATFIPEAYKPVDFDISTDEVDLEEKRQELIRLHEHALITEEEFEEKLNHLDLQ